ncbi:uncharacterized protein [Procambarus clarkii]|uniref:uncharacterized protein n=1 Tax=Procambarus clarkii TaxID=6728 RepID=UPI0037443B4E
MQVLKQVWATAGVEAAGGGREGTLPAHKRQSVQYSTLVGPYFVNATLNAHSHAPIGQTAYLTCIVRNLHNYTVSWVRARDIHLLTAGETTYTSDHRFVGVNPGGGAQWVLRLHHAHPSDAGTYLCQVSVTPPISTPVTLLVTEAVAKIYPGQEIFLKEGSRLVLTCEVHGCPYPAHPTWYRGRQVQDGTKVEEGQVTAPSSTLLPDTTTPFPATSQSIPSTTSPSATQTPAASTSQISTTATALATTSTSTTFPTTITTPTPIGLPIAKVTLTRQKAKVSHAGVYTCTNACTSPVNLTLHVLIGDEETAAMQHLSGAPSPIQRGGASSLLVVSAVTSWTWHKMTS